MVSKQLDRRAFRAKTAALSGSAVLLRSDYIEMATAAGIRQTNEREFLIKNRYLNFPVSYEEDDRITLELVVDSKVVRTLDIFLPDSEPDFWVFLDISDFKDKRALLRTGDSGQRINDIKVKKLQVYELQSIWQ